MCIHDLMKKETPSSICTDMLLCKMVLCIQTRKEFQMETVTLDFTEPCVLQIVPVLGNEIAIS